MVSYRMSCSARINKTCFVHQEDRADSLSPLPLLSLVTWGQGEERAPLRRLLLYRACGCGLGGAVPCGTVQRVAWRNTVLLTLQRTAGKLVPRGLA